MRQLISHDDLKKALFYNAEVGAFYWLHGVAFRSAGKRAGHAESTGRGRRITIDGAGAAYAAAAREFHGEFARP